MRWWLRVRRPLHFALILGLILSIQPPAPVRPVEAAHEPISYVYDAAGRLRAVVDPHGDTGEYVYDAVGNITSILRRASSAVSVVEFTPLSGPVGTTVTISGTGFSATPSQNTVTFNGTAASVTSSSSTRIVTAVPSGATTGTIAVTAPGGSATSTRSFTVMAAAAAPTISGLSPTLIDRGGTVTVSGANFETPVANDVVTVNGARAAVNTASATSLAIAAPGAATSGKVVVRTPAGNATSSQDLFIPPSPWLASDVVASGRVAAGSN
jgi:YD repeat-containing protein